MNLLTSEPSSMTSGAKAFAERTDCVARSNSFMFGTDREFRIAVANDRASRRHAWHVAYKTYLHMGYINPDPSELRVVPYDASPATTTFLVEDAATGEGTATCTVTPDSPLGLPMEKHHPEEIQRLRESGRRLCEIGKLVSLSEEGASLEVLMHTFRLAYLTARRLERCTDFVIEVRPHHVDFYCRMLLFERIGPERIYDTVNGTTIETIPLRLNLLSAEQRYCAKFGKLPGRKNLYRLFINDEEPLILEWLRKERRPMSVSDFRHFFMKQTRIYEEASPEHRSFLQSCYSGCDLDCTNVSAEPSRETSVWHLSESLLELAR